MIPDNLFKSLCHCCDGYDKFLYGQTIEAGYKPDYVLRKGDDFIILESENTSSRKTFIGGLIKAAHYLTGERTGILVFIMVPKNNTSTTSIAAQLKTYFSWIKDKTNLRKVYVIAAGQYYQSENVLKIEDADFNHYAIQV
ncbi:hypothetical protein EGT74_25915 [Chitinophaga lutea]|uniref:Uncharacterized protein n=1 Tax=Chitinophaga lutea TaxID=2488634 RepID=A0A3N4PAV3_9BACT|nr:hypothetical protein [Chitinophaga lutea]RPE05802.1 hypothetical protein EGT74_25915 [Chitinophaga lutea]